MDEIKLSRSQKALLLIIYDLSQGKTGVGIDPAKLLEESDKRQYHKMTDAEFHRENVRIVEKWDKYWELEGDK